MEGRPNYSPAGLLYYYDMFKNPEVESVHDRMWERQTPPPYKYCDQDQEPPRYGAHIHDDRYMGRLDHGIPPDRELDYLEPDPPRYGGRGRHVYDVDVYGGTYDETQFGNRHDDGYGMRDMGGHRGQFDVRGSRMDRGNEEVIDGMVLASRDRYSRYEYHDNRDLSPGNVGGLGPRLRRGPERRPEVFNDGIDLDGTSLLTPDHYPRHGYHENRDLSLGDVGGLGSGLTRGVESRPDDFNDVLGLHVRGVREFERGMRSTRAQRRHYLDSDVEDDAIRDDFRADHHRTNPYHSRYGAAPVCHSQSHLEDDDLADDFRGRGRGPGPHRSVYPLEYDFELNNEDVRQETMRRREHLRRQIHPSTSRSGFGMEPHKAQRGARSRGRPKRRFPDTSDDDDSEENRHISDSGDERIVRLRGRAGIPSLNSIIDSLLIQPRVQGHRARATATTRSTTATLDSNIAELPRGRHTAPQQPPRPYKRRSRHHTHRPRAHDDDASHHKSRHEPAAPPGISVKASPQAPVRPQTDLLLATSANTPADRPAEAATTIKAGVQESPRGGAPTAQRSCTHEADKRKLRGDQDDDAGNNYVVDVLRTADAKGQRSSDRNGFVRVEGGVASEADVGVDLFSNGSDDGFDTPGSGSEGSDDGGCVQSFVRIML